MMSNYGLIIKNMDLPHIYLAVHSFEKMFIFKPFTYPQSQLCHRVEPSQQSQL